MRRNIMPHSMNQFKLSARDFSQQLCRGSVEVNDHVIHGSLMWADGSVYPALAMNLYIILLKLLKYTRWIITR